MTGLCPTAEVPHKTRLYHYDVIQLTKREKGALPSLPHKH